MTVRQRIEERQFVICFQIQHPVELKAVGSTGLIFDERSEANHARRAAEECYLPANQLLLRLIEQHPEIKVTFSISGIALDQMEKYTPEVIDSFRKLADTGCVDFLAEPHYHSLSFLMESDEFEVQILQHLDRLLHYFGHHATVFRNAGLFYNDDVGRRIAMMGFNGILTEGTEDALRNSIPHNLYEHPDQNGLKLLFRNARLSDDIAFRVTDPHWNVTASQFCSWLDRMPPNEKLVTVALDYETFGFYHDEASGIFDFLERLLLMVVMQKSYTMATPSDIVQYSAEHPLSIPDYVAIGGADLSDWIGNDYQREAFRSMIALEHPLKARNDNELLKHWRSLQSIDHFFWMSERAYNSGSHAIYSSAQDAFDCYMQAIQHLSLSLNDKIEKPDAEKLNDAAEAERRIIHAPSWALNLDVNHGTGIRENPALKNTQ